MLENISSNVYYFQYIFYLFILARSQFWTYRPKLIENKQFLSDGISVIRHAWFEFQFKYLYGNDKTLYENKE